MTEPIIEEGWLGSKSVEAINETPESVSYLGVRLPKAQHRDSNFVPKRESYAFYHNDKFSLGLQRDVAVSLSAGDPLLIEGGTSIGKTTTLRKMASELGWEVHYVNLNGATDVEDLMGRYIPNAKKKGPEDPEYVFADGKVTSGLRQEDGKTKVIILDEYNAAPPNILIRLHEVLDVLEIGESVNLSEDASEAINVDKRKTKIVALTNPPGKGYLGREPMDPAQLRRWVYLKAPSELPLETFSSSTDALFGLAPKTVKISSDDLLISRDSVLLPEQLKEIPGIDRVLEKYKEFHKGIKQMLKQRLIAADQPQPFAYDDRMEPRRVRDFILNFYNGDINETIQKALRYYYSNKLESAEDKAKLDEIIKHVEDSPTQSVSQRRSLPLETSIPAAIPVVSKAPTAPVASSRIRQPIQQPIEQNMRQIKREKIIVPETRPHGRMFTPEAIAGLEKEGYDIYELFGESVQTLLEQGKSIDVQNMMYRPPKDSKDLKEMLESPARKTQVAIKPNALFLDEAQGLPFDWQEEMVRTHSEKLREKIPGVKAIIGKLPDYLELNFALDEEADYNIDTLQIRTSTVFDSYREKDLCATLTFGAGINPQLDSLSKEGTSHNASFIIPLVVPAEDYTLAEDTAPTQQLVQSPPVEPKKKGIFHR